ncbi:MAG TPA: NADH-quinone oxidoreductase subunit H [Polyangiaceae bacterium]|jgi:formate hydrogenlyase subunit 4|nr:NADH-quinone oxidoreductase subunit H [Polyangiaceae bacterium]
MPTLTIHTLVHVLVTLFLPPLVLGVITKTKAAFAGRVGAPFLQPYHDLIRLFRKGSVLSTTTTWIFRASPVVGVATALLAALLVPLGNHRAPLSFAGDFILFAYLFGLGRFFTICAALDTGSAFEGMGGAREATFSCLAEPALFLGLLVFVKRTASLSLSTMFGADLAGEWQRAGASVVLVLISLFIVLLAENCRIPFDDPNTHLELTMIHEVMVLDHSGPALGLISYGASLKLFVLGSVVVRLALPFDTGNPWADWAVFSGGILLLGVLIGVVESVMARIRLRQVPSLLVAACLLSGFGVILLAR